MNKKILSLALAGVMLVCNMSGTTAFAAQATTQAVQAQAQTTAAHNENSNSTSGTTMSAKEAEKKLKEQQAELEKNLKKTDAKLKELEKSSKVTEEYIDTLKPKAIRIKNRLKFAVKRIIFSQCLVNFRLKSINLLLI